MSRPKLTEEERKERKRVRNAKWYAKNKERRKEYMKDYSAKYYEANKEQKKELSAKWRVENKERVRAYSKEYRQANKHKPTVYYIPEEHYVGITENLYERIQKHKSLGKNIEGYRILKEFNTRQEAPLTFDMTTIGYASRPGYILKSNDMMKGKVKIVEIPEQRSLDVDTLFDLKLAKLLIKQ